MAHASVGDADLNAFVFSRWTDRATDGAHFGVISPTCALDPRAVDAAEMRAAVLANAAALQFQFHVTRTSEGSSRQHDVPWRQRCGRSVSSDSDADAPSADDPSEARVRRYAEACRTLPKVELHAHLNGCVRDETLMDCARANGIAVDAAEAALTKPDGTGARSLQRCFDLFGVIHRVCTDLRSLERIAAEAVLDFAADGVAYLELRTTPKDVPERGVDKDSYCEAVLTGVDLGMRLVEAKRGHRAIVARLILSVDRRESKDEATRTVCLAARLRNLNRGVVGVDLSGNPTLGSWDTFHEPMKLARMLDLPVTLHCGELANPREEEAMIDFRPERFGHCVKTVRDARLWARLRASAVPVELCITSNVITNSIHGGNGNGDGGNGVDIVDAAANHHLGLMHAAGHPLCLCTDDPGIFSTDLSREYALAAVAFGLGDDDVRRLATAAMGFAFLKGDDGALAEAITSKLQADAAAWKGLPRTPLERLGAALVLARARLESGQLWSTWRTMIRQTVGRWHTAATDVAADIALVGTA